MKAIKSLLAVSVLAAAGVASASTVDTISLSGTSSSASNGDFGHYTYLAPGAQGSVTAAGGVFNGTVHFSTDLSPGPTGAQADVTYQFTLDTSTNTATSLITNCQNAKLNQCNSNYKIGTTASYSLVSFNLTASTVNWQVSNTVPSSQLGEDVTTTFNYQGAVGAVPVPAAAWLFGSGLLGLAGTARRRRA